MNIEEVDIEDMLEDVPVAPQEPPEIVAARKHLPVPDPGGPYLAKCEAWVEHEGRFWVLRSFSTVSAPGKLWPTWEFLSVISPIASRTSVLDQLRLEMSPSEDELRYELHVWFDLCTTIENQTGTLKLGRAKWWDNVRRKYLRGRP